MIYPPRTRDTANLRRYGAWAGNPNGSGYTANRCAYEVKSGLQCARKPGHGPEGLYCFQHSRMVMKGGR
jgi:hypothetical protein